MTEEKEMVEACKVCDNNCMYCKYACNCSTYVYADENSADYYCGDDYSEGLE